MSTNTMTADEYANLSDEEIMNMAAPPVMEAPVVDDAGEGGDAGNEGKAAEGAGETAGSNPGTEGGSAADADDDEGAADEDEAGDASPAKPEDGKKADKDAAKEAVKPEQKPADGVDYKAAYEQIMAPFKANGKEIKLESVDEAIRLMQMGANYTKKLQALQPNLKLLKMLENNGLLDEGKLSYLIDLDKKNPAAIQKYLRESGVDPLDIDTNAEPTYKPGNHTVSDEQMAFSSTLEEVSSDPVGQQMVVLINRTWDAQSKQELWKDPNIMRVMTEHKQIGFYDTITNEMERRRILGTMPQAPFLHSYMQVGKDLDAKGLLTRAETKSAAQGNPGQQPARQVVETRPAPRKQPANNDKARAASPTGNSVKKVESSFNPLALSDEDFMKNADLAKRV